MADGLVITGPTASGKTSLAIDLALRISGEIISMDSRQVYRGMDIGTAKATPEQRAAVPHHGLDLLSPGERYSAGRFAHDARVWSAAIQNRGNVPVIAGGTGFFLRALTHPMFDEPPVDAARKELLREHLDNWTRAELLRWLSHLDEGSARRFQSEGGRHRLARALEIVLLTGRPLSAWHAEQQPVEIPRLVTVLLTMPRAELYKRINERVDQMFAAGLIGEVETLLASGYDERTTGMNATGYVEVLAYLRGETTVAQATESIRNASRRYARRQVTWFRHQLPPDTIVLDATTPYDELVETIVSAWSKIPGGAS